jgi:GNAT superfamily N-acetyltransferase
LSGVGVTVFRLCPQRLDDFLSFFDSEAFRDNPEWGFCYCQCFLEDHSRIDWARRKGTENRDLACSRVAANSMQGFLAYESGRVVGWCNAAPRSLFPALIGEPSPSPGRFATVLCFLVDPARRGQGVARALLEGACDGLRADGHTHIEANPRPDAQGDGANHFGPMSLYISAGFAVRREDSDGSVWVEKAL